MRSAKILQFGELSNLFTKKCLGSSSGVFVGDVAKTVLELILIIGLVGHVGWSMVYEI